MDSATRPSGSDSSPPHDRHQSEPNEVSALDLVETIRSVSAHARSGTLNVTGPKGQQRRIYFQDGLIKMVAGPNPEADSLEQALLDSRSFSEDEIEQARQNAQASGKSLAQVLLERGASKGVDAGKLLDSVTCREAATIVGWKEVSCSFHEGAAPIEGSEPYAARLSGGIDAEEILDALQRAARRKSH